MEYKILGSIWFGTIGIVAVDSNDHGWKCYIGCGLGDDEKTDEQKISGYGTPVGRARAIAAFPNLNPETFKS